VRLLGDWREVPLAELGADPRRLADRHEAISDANGPMIANSAMRSFRAIYNHARKTCRALPAENPVFAVDWNPDRRRDTALGMRDLPGWFEQAVQLENPIRREFHLLCLLTGSRPEALKVVELSHLDFRERHLHIPKPKGGEGFAFVIPMSRRITECVIRAMRFGQLLYPEESRTWLFPAGGVDGHLAEHKEDRAKVLSHWGNDLRQTYRTIGQVAGISDVDMHLLMNHSLPGVNAGYITRAKLMSDHLRAQQEKLSNLIVGAVVGQGRRPSGNLSRWLNATSRAQLDDLLAMDPDEIRKRFSSRSPMRRLELQAARCDRQGLAADILDPPSRRLRGVRQPGLRSSTAVRS
jgi:integrase